MQADAFQYQIFIKFLNNTMKHTKENMLPMNLYLDLIENSLQVSVIERKKCLHALKKVSTQVKYDENNFI